MSTVRALLRGQRDSKLTMIDPTGQGKISLVYKFYYLL